MPTLILRKYNMYYIELSSENQKLNFKRRISMIKKLMGKVYVKISRKKCM